MSNTPTPIDTLKGVLPNLVLNKLLIAGLTSVEEIYEVSPTDFAKMKGVGQKAVRQLIEFQKESYELQGLPRWKADPPIFSADLLATIGHCEVKHLESLIETVLYNKIVYVLKIGTFADFKKMTYAEFKSTRSIGDKVVKQLSGLIADLSSAPAPYLELHTKKTKGLIIAKEAAETKSAIELVIFVIDQFLNHLTKDGDPREAYIIDQFYGLTDGEQIELQYIGPELDLTGERARQLREKGMKKLKLFLNGQKLKKVGIRCAPAAVAKLQTIIRHFTERKVFTRRELRAFFSKEKEVNWLPETIRYCELFLKANGFSEVPSTYSDFSAEIFYAPKGERPKLRQFFTIGKEVLKRLNENAVDITAAELFTKLSGNKAPVTPEIVSRHLRLFPEVETLEETYPVRYQTSFARLATTGRRAKRVLYQMGKATHLNEITAALNLKMLEENLSKQYSTDQVRSAVLKEPGISARGKLSTYSMDRWGENVDSISTLIRKALIRHGEPLESRQLIVEVQRIRPAVKETSIASIIALDFLSLHDGTKILPEWENRYAQFLRPKYTGPTLKSMAVDFLQLYPEGVATQRVRRYLYNNTDFSRSSIYQLFYHHDCFEVFKEEEKSFVRLAEGYDPVLERKDPFIEEATEFLKTKPNQTCAILDFMEQLQSNNFQKNTLRKKVNQYPEHFFKYVIDGRAYVALIKK